MGDGDRDDHAGRASGGRTGVDPFGVAAVLFAAFDAMRESVVITEADLTAPGPRIVYVNEAFTRLTGWGRAEVIGLSPRILQGPLTDRAVLEHLRTQLQAGQTFQGHTWNYRRDGTPFRNEWYARPIVTDGRVTHFLSVQHEVTEARAALEHYRLMASSVLEGDSVVAALFDAHNRLLLASPAFVAVTGLRAVEGTTVTVDRLRAVLVAGPSSDAFLAACASGDAWRGDLRTRAERGGAVLAVQLHTVRDPQSGAIEGRVLTGIDETEPRRLLKLAENVSLADQISQAFGGLRHELGNPVNSVRMAVSLLSRRWREMDADRVDFYLTGMLQELDRMEFLLRSMRSFNETEMLEEQVVPLAPLVAAFTRLVLLQFRQHGAEFVVEVPEHLEVRGDRRAVFQVLVNLVNNALDAAADRAQPRVELTATEVGSRVRIAVRDNGHGMSEEVLRRATQPFFTSKPKGTGLGLAIVRNLLTRMGSRLSITSAAGVGTVTSFTLAGPDSGGESSVEFVAHTDPEETL